MDKNLACGPFFDQWLLTPITLRAPVSVWVLQGAANGPFKAHGSWNTGQRWLKQLGEQREGREVGEVRVEQLQPRAPAFLPCYHFCGLQRLFVSENSSLLFLNTSSCETTQLVSQDDLGQTHHGAGPDVVRGNKGAGVVWCQGIPQSKAGLGVNGFKKFPIVLWPSRSQSLI